MQLVEIDVVGLQAAQALLDQALASYLFEGPLGTSR